MRCAGLPEITYAARKAGWARITWHSVGQGARPLPGRPQIKTRSGAASFLATVELTIHSACTDTACCMTVTACMMFVYHGARQLCCQVVVMSLLS